MDAFSAFSIALAGDEEQRSARMEAAKAAITDEIETLGTSLIMVHACHSCAYLDEIISLIRKIYDASGANLLISGELAAGMRRSFKLQYKEDRLYLSESCEYDSFESDDYEDYEEFSEALGDRYSEKEFESFRDNDELYILADGTITDKIPLGEPKEIE